MYTNQSITRMIVSLLAVGMLVAFAVDTIAGDLEPTAPPAPTMKTLDEVEPRIPIGPNTTPGDFGSLFRITQPGSYYLSGDVLGEAGKHGIVITSSDVTIDLMGFALHGVLSSPLSNGIRIEGVVSNFTLRNGTITTWGNAGVNRTASGPDNSAMYVSLLVKDNGGDGIQAISNSLVQGCVVINNGGVGILTGSGSVIVNCTSSMNENGGLSTNLTCLVSGCLVSFNGDTGISCLEGSSVIDCVVRANASGIQLTDDCRAANNTIDSNSVGILVTGSNCRIEANQLSDCSTGIDVDAADNLIVRNSVTGGTTKYDIVAKNKVGVIVSAPNSGAISGSTGGAGVGTTDPWANLSF